MLQLDDLLLFGLDRLLQLFDARLQLCLCTHRRSLKNCFLRRVRPTIASFAFDVMRHRTRGAKIAELVHLLAHPLFSPVRALAQRRGFGIRL